MPPQQSILLVFWGRGKEFYWVNFISAICDSNHLQRTSAYSILTLSTCPLFLLIINKLLTTDGPIILVHHILEQRRNNCCRSSLPLTDYSGQFFCILPHPIADFKRPQVSPLWSKAMLVKPLCVYIRTMEGSYLMRILVRRIRVLWLQFTRTTEILWKKGTARPLSQGESAPTLALTGFHCFSGHITWRMILIYQAQVHFGWLPFTENKGEDVAKYIKEDRYLQM